MITYCHAQGDAFIFIPQICSKIKYLSVHKIYHRNGSIQHTWVREKKLFFHEFPDSSIFIVFIWKRMGVIWLRSWKKTNEVGEPQWIGHERSHHSGKLPAPLLQSSMTLIVTNCLQEPNVLFSIFSLAISPETPPLLPLSKSCTFMDQRLWT